MKRDFEKLVNRMVENARAGIAFERKVEPILRQSHSAEVPTGSESVREQIGLAVLKAS